MSESYHKVPPVEESHGPSMLDLTYIVALGTALTLAVWKAKTLLSCDKTIPETLQGIPASTCQIAAACGDQRYLDLMDILDELGKLEDSGEKEDAWSDAVEFQS